MVDIDELQELLEDTLLAYLEDLGVDDDGSLADELFIDIFKKYRRPQ